MASTAENSHRVNEYYRRAMEGHVYIRDTVDTLLATVGRRIEQLEPLGRRPRVLEVGAGDRIPSFTSNLNTRALPTTLRGGSTAFEAATPPM